MGKEYGDATSVDLPRYGRRLWDYLRAMRQVTEILSRDTTGSEGHRIKDILHETLPALCQAFASEVAFLADATGAVVAARKLDGLYQQALTSATRSYCQPT